MWLVWHGATQFYPWHHTGSQTLCMELHGFQRRFTLIIISGIQIKQHFSWKKNIPHLFQLESFTSIPLQKFMVILLPPHFQLVHLAQKVKIQRPKNHGATTGSNRNLNTSHIIGLSIMKHVIKLSIMKPGWYISFVTLLMLSCSSNCHKVWSEFMIFGVKVYNIV